MRSGKNAVLTASARGFEARAVSDKIPEKAIKKALDDEAARAQIQKCGGTPFFADEIVTDIEQGLTLPLSEINSMRRACLDELSGLLCSARAYTFDSSVALCKKSAVGQIADKPVFARFPSVESFVDGISEVAYLPLADCARADFKADKYGSEIYAELPRMLFGCTDAVRAMMRSACENGVKGFLAGGLDGVALAGELEADIHVAIGANVYNGITADVLADYGVSHAVLSAELTTRQIERLPSDISRGAFAYGRLPLMITRACPNENIGGCSNCKEKSLTDRMGVKFPLVCGYGFTELLNSRPVYMGDRLGELKCEYIFLYFTDESQDEIRRIAHSYKNALPPQGEFTRGLLYRGSI